MVVKKGPLHIIRNHPQGIYYYNYNTEPKFTGNPALKCQDNLLIHSIESFICTCGKVFINLLHICMLVSFCMYLWECACIFKLDFMVIKFKKSLNPVTKMSQQLSIQSRTRRYFYTHDTSALSSLFTLLNHWQGIQDMWYVWFHSEVAPDPAKQK